MVVLSPSGVMYLWRLIVLTPCGIKRRHCLYTAVLGILCVVQIVSSMAQALNWRLTPMIHCMRSQPRGLEGLVWCPMHMYCSNLQSYLLTCHQDPCWLFSPYRAGASFEASLSCQLWKTSLSSVANESFQTPGILCLHIILCKDLTQQWLRCHLPAVIACIKPVQYWVLQAVSGACLLLLFFAFYGFSLFYMRCFSDKNLFSRLQHGLKDTCVFSLLLHIEGTSQITHRK